MPVKVREELRGSGGICRGNGQVSFWVRALLQTDRSKGEKTGNEKWGAGQPLASEMSIQVRGFDWKMNGVCDEG